MTHPIPHSVLQEYGLHPERCSFQQLGEGHIHRTILVDTGGQTPLPVVFQKINTSVFPDVDALMHNMEVVTGHMAGQWNHNNDRNSTGQLRLISTLDNALYSQDEQNNYWRATWFLQGKLTFHRAPNAPIAQVGGYTVGDFMCRLSDLDPDSVAETIPRFHDLDYRLEQLDAACREPLEARWSKASELVGKVKAWRDEVLSLWRDAEEKGFPRRLVHNDTKFNNLLFSSSLQDAILIDLDTVMPGYAFYDFGDALRTCASTKPEDEENPESIRINKTIYEAFSRGYLEAAGDELTGAERESLPRAPGAFAFLMGVRFLMDYLQGDTYFATAHQEHNLQRARAQLQLMERFYELDGVTG